MLAQASEGYLVGLGEAAAAGWGVPMDSELLVLLLRVVTIKYGQSCSSEDRTMINANLVAAH